MTSKKEVVKIDEVIVRTGLTNLELDVIKQHTFKMYFRNDEKKLLELKKENKIPQNSLVIPFEHNFPWYVPYDQTMQQYFDKHRGEGEFEKVAHEFVQSNVEQAIEYILNTNCDWFGVNSKHPFIETSEGIIHIFHEVDYEGKIAFKWETITKTVDEPSKINDRYWKLSTSININKLLRDLHLRKEESYKDKNLRHFLLETAHEKLDSMNLTELKSVVARI